jgi:hypothetical protein
MVASRSKESIWLNQVKAPLEIIMHNKTQSKRILSRTQFFFLVLLFFFFFGESLSLEVLHAKLPAVLAHVRR